nr:hypothetical protein GCM10020092_099970 [Actinoplanes digitatis]
MSLGTTMLVMGGVIGLVLAGFGVGMLVTGKALTTTLRNFTEVRAAALYHLLFGVALLLLVMGQTLLTGSARLMVSALAVGVVVIAVLRFRPRRERPDDDK